MPVLYCGSEWLLYNTLLVSASNMTNSLVVVKESIIRGVQAIFFAVSSSPSKPRQVTYGFLLFDDLI